MWSKDQDVKCGNMIAAEVGLCHNMMRVDALLLPLLGLNLTS